MFLSLISPEKHRGDRSRMVIVKENPSLKTTKSDSQEHGYGVPMVRRIAENYQGMVDFKVEKGEFIASVMLSLQDNP